eukprot:1177720-Prorocentrum_minimum.AAC.5
MTFGFWGLARCQRLLLHTQASSGGYLYSRLQTFIETVTYVVTPHARPTSLSDNSYSDQRARSIEAHLSSTANKMQRVTQTNVCKTVRLNSVRCSRSTLPSIEHNGGYRRGKLVQRTTSTMENLNKTLDRQTTVNPINRYSYAGLLLQLSIIEEHDPVIQSKSNIDISSRHDCANRRSMLKGASVLSSSAALAALWAVPEDVLAATWVKFYHSKSAHVEL